FSAELKVTALYPKDSTSWLMPSRASASSSTIEISGGSDISTSVRRRAVSDHQIKTKHIIHDPHLKYLIYLKLWLVVIHLRNTLCVFGLSVRGKENREQRVGPSRPKITESAAPVLTPPLSRFFWHDWTILWRS